MIDAALTNFNKSCSSKLY